MSSKNSKKPKLSDPESVSDSASDSDDSSPPRKSKSKQKKGESSSSDSTPPRKDAKSDAKADAKAKPNKGNDSKGASDSSKSLRVAGEAEPTWELGGKKFITIRDFKGKTYINIREYYEKDGKVLPGKKGIALNNEQWQSLCSSIDEVNKVLNK